MKLRLKGNTLRLRLSRAEVAAVGRGECLEEATAFAPGVTLRCTLAVGPEAAARATFDGGRIAVTLPDLAARQWATGDEVGIAGAQPVGTPDAPATLEILVEKDFPCAGRDEAANADAFAPPGGRPRC